MPPENAKHGLDVIQIVLHAHWISQCVFALLVVCSIVSVGVIIERSLVLSRTRKANAACLEQLDQWRSKGAWQEARTAITASTREQEPLFSVLKAGIVYWQELAAVGETRLEVLESLAIEQVARELRLVRAMLRSNLPVLANITSVAPFIGLFGTVVGIILTFDAISRSGNMGQDLVASGIADALIATAMGLFAAIPAVLAYNYFTDKVSQVVLGMEEVAMERIYFLMQREGVAAGSGGSVEKNA